MGKGTTVHHEDLSLIPELTQNPGTAAHLDNGIRREARTGISQGFAGQSVQLIWLQTQ